MSTPLPENARCSRHPELPAMGVCARCGTFVCLADKALLDGELYCASCAARPDVDWLEAFRLRYWGKRDGWAWLIGLGALVNAFACVVTLVGGEGMVTAVILALGAVISACFWLGMPWARYGVLVLYLANGAISLGADAPANFIAFLFGLFIALIILVDTRNKLFFKVAVPREQLRRMWHLYANNPAARSGFFLGVVGLFVPPFALGGLVCSVIGLRRVDLTARPPVGRKGQAIAGIVLGAIGIFTEVALVIHLFAR